MRDQTDGSVRAEEGACASARPMKMAYVASLYDHIRAFHLPVIRMLREHGVEVHVYACPDSARADVEAAGLICRDIPFRRNPAHPANGRALLRLLRAFRREGYDAVHTHTPTGGWVGRVAAAAAGVPRVLYTAHGFHFYKGGPLLHWLLFYPVERALARLTDGLVTINPEDRDLAAAFRLRTRRGQVCLINGMGIEPARYGALTEGEQEEIRQSVREELGAARDLPVLISVGEINRNKNQLQVLEAVEELFLEGWELQVWIAGEGSMKEELQDWVRSRGLDGTVRFLGYRRDVPGLLRASDVFVLPSRREGLGLAAVEAMAAGLPVIMGESVGGRCLVRQGVTGYRVPHGGSARLAALLRHLLTHPAERRAMGEAARAKAADYGREPVLEKLKALYRDMGIL